MSQLSLLCLLITFSTGLHAQDSLSKSSIKFDMNLCNIIKYTDIERQESTFGYGLTNTGYQYKWNHNNQIELNTGVYFGGGYPFMITEPNITAWSTQISNRTRIKKSKLVLGIGVNITKFILRTDTLMYSQDSSQVNLSITNKKWDFGPTIQLEYQSNYDNLFFISHKISFSHGLINFGKTPDSWLISYAICGTIGLPKKQPTKKATQNELNGSQLKPYKN